MSKLGAKKKRESMEWVLIPMAPEPEPEPRVWPPCTEEEAKRHCEEKLTELLTRLDPAKNSGEWYQTCVENSVEYPQGSYRSVFWWALRLVGNEHSDLTLHNFRQYLEWKIGEYDSGRIRREGPVW